MTNAILKDQNARDQATDIFSSCIVSAPAGSGKTGLLTTRVLKLLAIVEQPEEILCITFTRKAAAEMRERIFASLNEARSLVKDSTNQTDTIFDDLDIDEYEKDRLKLAYAALLNSEKRDWDIFNAVYRLKVSTIDGFCKSLSTRLPFLSQMGVESGILDDATQAYREAVNLWLDDKLQQSDPIIDLVHSHFGGNVEQLIQMLVNLLSVREQWLPFAMLTRSELESNEDNNFARQYFESYIKELINEAIDEAQEILSPYEAEICDLMNFAATNLSSHDSNHPLNQYHLPHSRVHTFEEFSHGDMPTFLPTLVDFLLTKTNTIRKSATVREGFPSGKNKEEKANFTDKKNHFKRIMGEISEYPNAEAIISKLRTLPPSTYEENQWKTLSLIVRSLPDLVAYLRIVFSNKNKTDFTEYTLSAVRALDDEGDVDLQQKLDYQIKHILIDEFQDTSQPQLNLLQSLIKEWVPDEEKTLFIVGDGMQSCYGFRNANVGIFLGVKKFGLSNISPKPLELNVNFRSTAKIVTWVNSVFANAFPAEDSVSKGAVRYSTSFAKQQTTDDSSISCKYFPDDDISKASDTEARYITQKIIHSRIQNPDQSIAILAKNRSTFGPIITALQEQNIPFEAVDIDALSSKRYIQDIHCITRVCFDISDRIAWISLLRSPFVGLNFSDLYHVCTNDIDEALTEKDAETHTDKDSEKKPKNINLWLKIQNNQNISGLSKDGKKVIQRLAIAFQQFDDNRYRSPLKKHVESLWIQLGGPETLSSKSDLNDINVYLHTLQSTERAGNIDNWQEFEQGLDKLYAKAETFLASDNPIQIMTMHKSKGLEFDRVFLPGLQKTGRPDEKALLYWLEKTNSRHESQFLLSPLSSIDEQSNPLSDFIATEKKQKTEFEDVRLFYVACTRAKKHLHLSAVLNENAKGDLKPPAKNSLLSKVWSHIGDEFTASIEEDHLKVSPTIKNINDNLLHQDTLSKASLPPYILRLPIDWKNIAESQQLDTLSAPDETLTTETSHSNIFSAPKDSRVKEHSFNNSQLDVFSEFEDANKIEREVGTLLHRILHRVAQDSVSMWSTQKIATHKPFWLNQLIQTGVAPSDAISYVDRLANIIIGLLVDPKALWILDSTHHESASEFPLSWKGRQSIIDRTFVVAANEELSVEADTHKLRGTRWIIDYKSAGLNNLLVHSEQTSDTNTPLTAQFYEQQKSQYKTQLLGYKEVLKAYDESQNKYYHYRLALYFPAHKVFCEY